MQLRETLLAGLVIPAHPLALSAQRKLDELIGLSGPKEQITVWRTEIQIDQILASRGEETSVTNENHMVLEGPPGTAKTSFARIAAEILFGLGKIEHPTVVEVTEEDLVVGYISQTAARMKEVCESALGGVLFIGAWVAFALVTLFLDRAKHRTRSERVAMG